VGFFAFTTHLEAHVSLIDLFVVLVAALIYAAGHFAFGQVFIVTLIVIIVLRLVFGERLPSRQQHTP
jgi:hypothetical protein